MHWYPLYDSLSIPRVRFVQTSEIINNFLRKINTYKNALPKKRGSEELAASLLNNDESGYLKLSKLKV